MAITLKTCKNWTSHLNRRYWAGTTGNGRLLDLHVPNNGVACPLVVYLHGGAWQTGDKQVDVAHTAYLVKRGWAVACINYRYSQDAIWPAQLYDVKNAIRWLRANGAEYRLTTGKVGVWGISAGGHLALMAGFTNGQAVFETGANLGKSSQVSAIAADCAPNDLRRWCTDPASPNPNDCVTALLGGSPFTQTAAATQASPMAWVKSGLPATGLWHGSADVTVPPSQSSALRTALLGASVPVGLITVSGGHASTSFFTDARVAQVHNFFSGFLLS